MPSARGLLGLALLAFGLACGDLKELLVLQQDLAREFPNSSINVSLHGSNDLTVVFANSSNAELSEGDRAAFARRVAEYVRDHYIPYEQLQRIRVGFATVRGGGGFSLSTTSVPYAFTTGELGSPKRPKVDSSGTLGQRVLVIMISRSNHNNAWLVTGRGQASEEKFQVIPDSGASPFTLDDVTVRENGFGPEVLPQLVTAEYWSLAQQLSQDVSRCIPVFVDDVPAGRPVPGFVGGVTAGQGGKIFLMPR
jgi:hypothetical protein